MMDEEQIRQLFQSHRRSVSRRGFRCPDEQTLAAYVDGQFPGKKRNSFEKHLLKCEWCLDTIGFLARSADWNESVEVPAYLVARARGLLTEKSASTWRWQWAFATAAAACVVLVVTFVVWKSRVSEPSVPEQGSLIAQNQQPAPVEIVKPPAETERPLPSNSVARPNLNRGEMPSVRRSEIGDQPKPTLLFPREGGEVSRNELEFRWQPVSDAISYEVRLASAEGSLKFVRETKDLTLRLGDDVQLQPGVHYYVTVRAQTKDGRFIRSDIVMFRLKND